MSTNFPMTKRPRLDFMSDNTAGACPEAMSALIAANGSFVAGYGADDTTKQSADSIRRILNSDAEVRFVSTGTAGNAIACAMLCRPYETIAASECAHVLMLEAGAPSFFGRGLQIEPIDGDLGRIRPEAFRVAVSVVRPPARQRLSALSLTNATECGTIYDRNQFLEICGIAHEAGLGIHVDGARLVNAVAAGFDPKLIAAAGVDILVLSGSKAGAPFSEAVVLLNKSMARGLDAHLKQAGQLASKTRFLAAPWLGMLDGQGDNIPWISHARHANAMAKRIGARCPLPILYPVETNAVFIRMTDMQVRELAEKGWRLRLSPDGSMRVTCSWATSTDAVDELIADICAIAETRS